MQLEHEFSVPAPPDVVWTALTDPQRVAPCMPGATLSNVDGNEFAGTVKVKLGPVSLLYKGSGEFVETDEKAHRVLIKASGKDSRGNGTASASVTVTVSANGAGSKATVVTDLNITGKPAQFGRGMIAEVGGKILDTFATCLASKLAPDDQETGQSEKEDSAADDEAEKPKPSTRKRASTAKAATKPATRSTASKPVASTAASTAPASTSGASVTAKANGAPAPKVNATKPADKPAHLEVVDTPAGGDSGTEPIDLLDYAGASVAKRAIPLVLALLVAFIVIRRLRHRH